MVLLLVCSSPSHQHWLCLDRLLTAFAREPVCSDRLSRQGDGGQRGQRELHGEVYVMRLMVRMRLGRGLVMVREEECGVWWMNYGEGEEKTGVAHAAELLSCRKAHHTSFLLVFTVTSPKVCNHDAPAKQIDGRSDTGRREGAGHQSWGGDSTVT